MSHEQYDETKIIQVEDNGFEMNITVASYENEVLKDSKALKEIVDLALGKGYSRFVGTSGEYNDKPEIVFIFSKENYFDEDDCLVRNPAASKKISRIIEKRRR